MTGAWRKIVADVRRERTRWSLVGAAIALGLTAFFAVLSTYAILDRELNRGYLATNPASFMLTTDAVDPALLNAIAARRDVAQVDLRRVVAWRIRTGPDDWRRLVLFVIRDFRNLQISTVTPEAGEWPPQPGTFLMERDAFRVARAQIGDVVDVRADDGRTRTLRVGGRVHDAGQAQARMENLVYGYITPDTLRTLGEAPTLNRLYVIVAGDRLDAAHVGRVAADTKAWLEEQGHKVQRLDVPTPGQHPHAAIMGLLLLVMAAFGGLALLLGGVIAANLIVATIAGERRQIGILKAIGAGRATIARIYLTEAALIGVAALCIALPAGWIGGGELSRRFAVLLNFDLATMAIPVWVYLLIGAAAVVVPVVAAAVPVASATEVPVRVALAPAGVERLTATGERVAALLARVARVSHAPALGVRNLARRPMRAALTATTLTMAGTFFMAAVNIRRSMEGWADRMYGAGTFGSASRYAIDQHMLMIYVFLLIVAGVLAVVGSLALATATSLNVMERRREIGVLRALGARPVDVATIVVVEAVAVAVFSSLLAALTAWPITVGLGAMMRTAILRRGFDTMVDPAAIGVWIALSVVVSVIASMAPAMSASRLSVREAVSYE